MSGCYCDDGDHPETYRHGEVAKSRKEYRCCECSKRLPVGSAFQFFWGVWSGEAATYRTCFDCVAFKNWCEAHVPCICWNSFGSMIDDALETMREYDDDCPGLYAETQEKVKALYAGRAPAKLEA